MGRSAWGPRSSGVREELAVLARSSVCTPLRGRSERRWNVERPYSVLKAMTDLSQMASDAASRARPTPGVALASLAPSAIFLAVNNWFGLVPAMVAATMLSAVVIVVRRSRNRTVGLLLPISLGYVIVRGVAGVLTGSEDVYFGFGILTNAALAIAVGVSAFTRYPIAILLLPLVVRYRHVTEEHWLYRRVAAQITFLWAAAELSVTAWEAWHLSQSTASEFIVGRAVVAWPVMAVVIFFLIFYVRFRLDPHERHLEFQLRSREA